MADYDIDKVFRAFDAAMKWIHAPRVAKPFVDESDELSDEQKEYTNFKRLADVEAKNLMNESYRISKAAQEVQPQTIICPHCHKAFRSNRKPKETPKS